MNKMCRHFARKVSVAMVGSRGRINFPFGICRIRVTDRDMLFRIEACDAQSIGQAEQAVEELVCRIAGAHDASLEWQRTR